MRQRRAGLVVTALLVLSSAGAWAADNGADLYKSAKCANCHGADGAVNTPMGKKLGVKPLRDPSVSKLSEKDFVDITTKGKGRMPAYKGTLTTEQIKAVASYLRGLGK